MCCDVERRSSATIPIVGIDASFCDKFPREKRAGAGVGTRGGAWGGQEAGSNPVVGYVRGRHAFLVVPRAAAAARALHNAGPHRPHRVCSARGRGRGVAVAQDASGGRSARRRRGALALTFLGESPLGSPMTTLRSTLCASDRDYKICFLNAH